MMLRSLAFKWTITLFLTSLIGVVLAGVFAYCTTITEYDRLRNDQARESFIEDALEYYQRHGTWSGIETWFYKDPDKRSSPGHPPQQFALVNTDGIVVVGHGPFHVGDAVTRNDLAKGTPVLIDGEQIGTALLAQPPPELDPRERTYINSTNRALLIGAFGAGITALVIGLLLSRQFLRPLSELTRAITAMHAGDLDQQVQIRTRDELGILAQTFNEMSANLYRANQLRKQMTADIAHDLRTPLTVIAGYLEALCDGTLKPTPERFRIMSEEVNLLQRLVEDLRTLSLADAGELKLMRGIISPNELLDRVAASFQEAAAAYKVQLEVELDKQVPELWIDGERMVQVLGNLVTNALHHTPSGGKITLKMQRVLEGIQIQVCDTGSGIAPADLPKIFDRFYRADPSRQSSNGTSSGLGLAIAKSIVEAHNGTITAASNLGEGTTISVFLPAHPYRP